MAKQNVENEEIGSAQNPIEKYQKPLLIAGIALIAITFGYMGYSKFYVAPKAERGAADMFMAEKYFEQDSFELALNGNASFLGFEEIVSDYGMTDAGNLAHYYAGVSYLRLGAAEADSSKAQVHFQDAIDHLKKFSSSSKMITPMALGATGDAYSELGEYAQAASYYMKAGSTSPNEYTAPMYLKKAGLVYEKMGDKAKALKAYQTIKADFGKTTIGGSIDKYISRAENR